jgi:hypothetical protein
MRSVDSADLIIFFYAHPPVKAADFLSLFLLIRLHRRMRSLLFFSLASRFV